MPDDRLGIGKIIFPSTTDKDLHISLDEFATRVDDNMNYLFENGLVGPAGPAGADGADGADGAAGAAGPGVATGGTTGQVLKKKSVTDYDTEWKTNSTLVDADGDTKVEVEQGADEDKVRVSTGGTERTVFDSSGLEQKSGDVAVQSGAKLNLEGISGDSYMTHNSTSGYVELWVDGVKRAEF